MSHYDHILLATDLTPAATHTAKKAMELAEVFGGRLSVVHVVETLPGYAAGYVGMVTLEQDLVEQAKTHMKELAKMLIVPENDTYVRVGSPKSVILDLAKEQSIDLIIVGSHGRHGIDKLLGSTAGAILHGAQCDVLTIKTEDK